ncbi:tRNA (adenosine(37)-N6)-threonylcarbamoyltransferase complex dimerization subunit type 1 TsaB [Allorhodopirellula solitaria]|uniref:tRNA threonylcarbamoyladenosine biosynthesis protein TsaB n=1 Tax=Allorhodopirellula solitaria TaxID=2527987 RepID=A0A5C5YG85_9BACT|nr:tRNA (adenosine(37)-N6)-threonylcarbamoyltransferase complex dimerization subunit type 1 TsaB [Allorhodopirellula solitaria]TWT74138.1 tRNA threonylcarbamoyladenosine biosynthesis protein TsaB [Allorhodopirellula solitaria]
MMDRDEGIVAFMKFVQQPMQQEISGPPAPSSTANSLAIEVIGREGSIALLAGTSVIAARSLARHSRAAACLAQTIDELASEFLSNGSLDSLGSVAVASGPGSFTGLRIAVTTAKTLAYALQIPLVAVNSLAAIAELAPAMTASPASQSPQRRPVLVGLAAYRGQVYRGRFVPGQAAETGIVSADDWKAEVLTAAPRPGDANGKKAENNFIFAGDRSVFASTDVRLGPDSWCDDEEVRAVGVGRVAAGMLARGETTDPIELVPDYLRPSSAEEKAG